MAQKPWDQLSPNYRRRLERAQEKAAREGREFNRSRARGHGTNAQGTEYQRRKSSEKRRAGRFYPLTPAEVAQLRSFGATDGDLELAARAPRARVRDWIKQQKAHAANPNYSAPWSLAQRVAEAEARYGGKIPPVLFFYHSWR